MLPTETFAFFLFLHIQHPVKLVIQLIYFLSQNVNMWTLWSMEGIMFYNQKFVILFLLNKCFTISQPVLHCFVENILSGIDTFLQNKKITSKANSSRVLALQQRFFALTSSNLSRFFYVPFKVFQNIFNFKIPWK